MPLGDFINQIPAPVFMLIHLSRLRHRRVLRLAQLRRRRSLLGWVFASSRWPRSAT